MSKIKWCELCDEIEAQHADNSLCWNCYMRTHYATVRGVKWIMQRRKNLKLYLRTTSFCLGQVDVHDIEEQREKKTA